MGRRSQWRQWAALLVTSAATHAGLGARLAIAAAATSSDRPATLALLLANLTGFPLAHGLGLALDALLARRRIHVCRHQRSTPVSAAAALLLLLAAACSLLWLNSARIFHSVLLQSAADSAAAADLLRRLLPDLFLQMILHPVRAIVCSSSNKNNTSNGNSSSSSSSNSRSDSRNNSISNSRNKSSNSTNSSYSSSSSVRNLLLLLLFLVICLLLHSWLLFRTAMGVPEALAMTDAAILAVLTGAAVLNGVDPAAGLFDRLAIVGIARRAIGHHSVERIHHRFVDVADYLVVDGDDDQTAVNGDAAADPVDQKDEPYDVQDAADRPDRLGLDQEGGVNDSNDGFSYCLASCIATLVETWSFQIFFLVTPSMRGASLKMMLRLDAALYALQNALYSSVCAIISSNTSSSSSSSRRGSHGANTSSRSNRSSNSSKTSNRSSSSGRGSRGGEPSKRLVYLALATLAAPPLLAWGHAGGGAAASVVLQVAALLHAAARAVLMSARGRPSAAAVAASAPFPLAALPLGCAAAPLVGGASATRLGLAGGAVCSAALAAMSCLQQQEEEDGSASDSSDEQDLGECEMQPLNRD